jgi:tripartite-type tricarboxylate transporter receptor subunit TctC
MKTKSLFVALALSLGGILPMPAISRAEFPERDISWIVPYAAGGGYDVWARALGQAMAKDLPKNVRIVVKNVTGAAGRTGTVQLYRSKPDGYTIGMVDLGLLPYQIAVGPEKAGYDLDRFAWIAAYAEAPWTIAVKKGSPLKSLKDVKAQGAKLRWGALGPGETHWLAALITTGEMGLPLNLVTGYSGAAELAPALMRGDFDIAPLLSTTALPHVKSGDLVPIAVLADERFAAYPETPTAKEQGFPIISPFIRLAAAPPGTSSEVVKVLEGLLLKAIKDPELKKWADSTGRGFEIVRPGGSETARRAIQAYIGVSKKYQKEISAAIQVGK